MEKKVGRNLSIKTITYIVRKINKLSYENQVKVLNYIEDLVNEKD